MGFEYYMGKTGIDKWWFGTIAGIIVPVLSFILVYRMREPDMNLISFIETLYFLRALPKLMSLCLLPNLILFFAFMRFDKLHAAKGVIYSLFVLAVPIILLKIF